MSNDGNERMPLSKIALPVARKPTMAYSFKASDGNGVAPTESFGAESVSFPAAPVASAPAPITVPDPKPQPAQTSVTSPSLLTPYTPPINDVKNLVSLLIEKDVEAWRCLPDETRSVLLENANRVQLVQDTEGNSSIPNIVYDNVELKYNGYHWQLVKIHKDKL